MIDAAIFREWMASIVAAVVWIQLQLRDLARAAGQADAPLPLRYDRLSAFGSPAASQISRPCFAILWLMTSKPSIGPI
jgi:uncharacterized membrane protein